MSLNERLTDWWNDTRARAPEVYSAYTELVRELKANRVGRTALGVGDYIPPFVLPNVEGRLVRSHELLRRGALVLSFFRGGWCPYCAMELAALQEVLSELRAKGAELAAVTPDTSSALAADKRAAGITYEVLSDADNGLALLFGLVFRVPDAIRLLWLKLGIDLGARHGNDRGVWLLPVPATYIVDARGQIRFAYVEPDFRKRMEPAEIVRRVASLADKSPASKP